MSRLAKAINKPIRGILRGGKRGNYYLHVNTTEREHECHKGAVYRPSGLIILPISWLTCQCTKPWLNILSNLDCGTVLLYLLLYWSIQSCPWTSFSTIQYKRILYIKYWACLSSIASFDITTAYQVLCWIIELRLIMSPNDTRVIYACLGSQWPLSYASGCSGMWWIKTEIKRCRCIRLWRVSTERWPWKLNDDLIHVFAWIRSKWFVITLKPSINIFSTSSFEYIFSHFSTASLIRLVESVFYSKSDLFTARRIIIAESMWVDWKEFRVNMVRSSGQIGTPTSSGPFIGTTASYGPFEKPFRKSSKKMNPWESCIPWMFVSHTDVTKELQYRNRVFTGEQVDLQCDYHPILVALYLESGTWIVELRYIVQTEIGIRENHIVEGVTWEGFFVTRVLGALLVLIRVVYFPWSETTVHGSLLSDPE